MARSSSLLGIYATLLRVCGAYHHSSVTGTSWGPQRIDIFGVNSNQDIWHKFYTPFGWEPNTGPGRLEIFANASADSVVSTASWGINRLNFVFIDDDAVVRHKYWDGSNWGPQGDSFEDLGKGPEGAVAFNSWGSDRLDLVGVSDSGTILHKAWTGSSWYPSVDAWEDLGGESYGQPATVSWSVGRLDIFAIADGQLKHRFWDGGQWIPEDNKWESLGGDKLRGTPVATSMSPGRVDVWALGKDASLQHLFWDGSSWRGWESLGGSFSVTPKVVHWGPNRIDIIGTEKGKKGEYVYKYWDGYQWSDWIKKGGPFSSEPAAVSVAENNLNLFGVDEDGKVKLQVWDGSQWLPSASEWYELGDIRAEEDESKPSWKDTAEQVLSNSLPHVELRFRA